MFPLGASKFPRVTLLIPVFESAAYVGDAITSALNQTYGHVEIIVAPDDGETYQHLRQTFTSPQVRIIQPGPASQTGAGQTRNRAIDASTGEFFTMLDADDLIPPTYIEELMRIAATEGAAIAPVHYTGWDTNEVVRVPPLHKGVLSLTGYAQLVASVHPILHRSLETGYCDGFAEDVVHDGIAIAKLGTVRVVDSVHYQARIREASACNNGADMERSIQHAYRKRIEQIELRPTELAMQTLTRSDRRDFADLFRFRAYVSKAFSGSGASCYNAWVAGREASLWDEFNAVLTEHVAAM